MFISEVAFKHAGTPNVAHIETSVSASPFSLDATDSAENILLHAIVRSDTLVEGKLYYT